MVCDHALRTLQVCSYLAGVDPSQEHHGCQHEYRIEYVQENLVRDEIPIVALRILNQAENAPDQDQDAGAIERI